MSYEKGKLKKMYDGWCELLDQRKDLNAEINDLLKEAAGLTGQSKAQVASAFKYNKKLEDKGNDELDGVSSVFIELRDE